jgi:hypothetical protein
MLLTPARRIWPINRGVFDCRSWSRHGYQARHHTGFDALPSKRAIQGQDSHSFRHEEALQTFGNLARDVDIVLDTSDAKTDRAELAKAIGCLRKGITLVAWKLGWLAGSMKPPRSRQPRPCKTPPPARRVWPHPSP